jgi:aspartate 1-decarboxylase
MIELNGATAHLGRIGDRLTIMSFARCTPEEAALHKPRVLILNEKNEVARYDVGGSVRSLNLVAE